MGVMQGTRQRGMIGHSQVALVITFAAHSPLRRCSTAVCLWDASGLSAERAQQVPRASAAPRTADCARAALSFEAFGVCGRAGCPCLKPAGPQCN